MGTQYHKKVIPAPYKVAMGSYHGHYVKSPGRKKPHVIFDPKRYDGNVQARVGKNLYMQRRDEYMKQEENGYVFVSCQLEKWTRCEADNASLRWTKLAPNPRQLQKFEDWTSNQDGL